MMRPLKRLAGAAPRARLPMLFAAACLAAGAAQAGSMHKCVIAGKVIYQDIACPVDMGSVAAERTRAAQVKDMERRLDRLQAQGKGMVQRHPPGTAELAARAAQDREGTGAAQDQHAGRANDASAARLGKLLDEARKACGGELPHFPALGMTDEFFRKCTVHARLGGMIQVVAIDDGPVPGRLYIFPSLRANRVYAVGGVVTKVSP